jgi:hypothetical protein
MTRVCVDNSPGTTVSTKKEVDNECLTWYKAGDLGLAHRQGPKNAEVSGHHPAF